MTGALTKVRILGDFLFLVVQQYIVKWPNNILTNNGGASPPRNPPFRAHFTPSSIMSSPTFLCRVFTTHAFNFFSFSYSYEHANDHPGRFIFRANKELRPHGVAGSGAPKQTFFGIEKWLLCLKGDYGYPPLPSEIIMDESLKCIYKDLGFSIFFRGIQGALGKWPKIAFLKVC